MECSPCEAAESSQHLSCSASSELAAVESSASEQPSLPLTAESAVILLRGFLRWLRSSVLYLQWCVQRFRAARQRSRLQEFLRSYASQREGAVSSTVSFWAAEEARLRAAVWQDQAEDGDNDLAEQISESRPELSIPEASKQAVVKELYQRELVAFHKRDLAYLHQLQALRARIRGLVAAADSQADLKRARSAYAAMLQKAPKFSFAPDIAQLVALWTELKDTPTLLRSRRSSACSSYAPTPGLSPGFAVPLLSASLTASVEELVAVPSGASICSARADSVKLPTPPVSARSQTGAPRRVSFPKGATEDLTSEAGSSSNLSPAVATSSSVSLSSESPVSGSLRQASPRRSSLRARREHSVQTLQLQLELEVQHGPISRSVSFCQLPVTYRDDQLSPSSPNRRASAPGGPAKPKPSDVASALLSSAATTPSSVRKSHLGPLGVGGVGSGPGAVRTPHPPPRNGGVVANSSSSSSSSLSSMSPPRLRDGSGRTLHTGDGATPSTSSSSLMSPPSARSGQALRTGMGGPHGRSSPRRTRPDLLPSIPSLNRAVLADREERRLLPPLSPRFNSAVPGASSSPRGRTQKARERL
eukprot:RCo043273